MLFGFAFLSHQIGGFLGVWLGGLVFDAYGSYNPVWWLSVAFGVASAIINLPIVEEPVDRSGDRGRLSRHHAIRLAESVNSLSVATAHVFSVILLIR